MNHRPKISEAYRTRRCISHYHTPLGRLSRLEASTGGIVSVPKKSALKTSRRELSEDVSFGIGTLLGVEQSSLKNRPREVIMDMLGDALDNVDRGCVYQR